MRVKIAFTSWCDVLPVFTIAFTSMSEVARRASRICNIRLVLWGFSGVRRGKEMLVHMFTRESGLTTQIRVDMFGANVVMR
jgi:hypothetical protein